LTLTYAPVASAAPKPPAQLLASVLAAGGAQRSVHYVAAANYGGGEIRQVVDAAITRGIQRIAYRQGAKTGHVTVIVAAHTAYVRGDAFTLVNYMGFKAAPAAKYANRVGQHPTWR
jgi:broad specificity phosphatase PhoE